MSELVGGAAAAETPIGSAAEAGAIMRRAREALGLRIEVLAASLKVPVAKLEALERKVGSHDQALSGVIDAIRQLMAPPAQKKRSIGFINES